MSREWSRHSFKAVAPNETFQRRHDDPPVTTPKGFSPQEPAGWRNADGFVRRVADFARAEGFSTPRRTFANDAAAFVPSHAFGQPPIEDEPAGENEIVEVQGEIVEPADPAPDLIAIARAEAFAEGFAEGERVTHAAMAGEAAACARLIVTLTGSTQFDRPGLAQRLQQTVLHLVRQTIGDAGVSAEKLAERIENAVSMLADVTEPARVHLNPHDLALIGDQLPTHIAMVGNPQIERGGFRMETLSATIEDGPSMWLEQLADALDRVPLAE